MLTRAAGRDGKIFWIDCARAALPAGKARQKREKGDGKRAEKWEKAGQGEPEKKKRQRKIR